MENKENFEEELREISPFLANLKKDDPFKTPKFYFDTLADKVIEKAQIPVVIASTSSPTMSLGERIRTWIAVLITPRYAMALSTILFLTVGAWYFLKPVASKKTVESVEEITTEDIQNYIKENIKDFDEKLIFDKGSVADTEGGDALPQLDINEEDIEKYLQDNIEDEDLKIIESELQ
jgi:hypothetical protein